MIGRESAGSHRVGLRWLADIVYLFDYIYACIVMFTCCWCCVFHIIRVLSVMRSLYFFSLSMHVCECVFVRAYACVYVNECCPLFRQERECLRSCLTYSIRSLYHWIQFCFQYMRWLLVVVFIGLLATFVELKLVAHFDTQTVTAASTSHYNNYNSFVYTLLCIFLHTWRIVDSLSYVLF